MGKTLIETNRKWRKDNPEKIREYKRAYYAKHREKVREKCRAYYAENKNRIIELQNIANAKDPDRRRALSKARRDKDPDKFREWNKAHAERNPHAWRVHGAKQRAKEFGVDFDLDAQWFEEKIKAGVCEMSGLPFVHAEKIGTARNPNAPSVDRINPKGPYTKSNCRLILWWLNRALSDRGEEYAVMVFRGVFQKLGVSL